MRFQRSNQSTSRNSQNAEKTSIFASRPAVIQTQDLQLAPTAEEIEQENFATTNNFSHQKTSRFNHDFSRIPLHSPTTPIQRLIQPQLTIGKAGDKYEQEADRVAADVVNRMHQPESEKVQRQEIEEDEEVQRKAEIGSIQRQELAEDENKLQMKPIVQRLAGEGGMTATPDLEASIQQARGSGQPLAENVQKPMEQAFGFDFSRVKVHTNPHSDRLNQSIQAKAFTTGRDIFFRQGAYDPSSRGGQELIAHELTHVVQQTGNAVKKAGNNGRESRVNLQTMKKENGEEVVIQGQFVTSFGEPLPLKRASELIEDFKKSSYYSMLIRTYSYTEQEINDALDEIEIKNTQETKIVVQGVHNDATFKAIKDTILRARDLRESHTEKPDSKYLLTATKNALELVNKNKKYLDDITKKIQELVKEKQGSNITDMAVSKNREGILKNAKQLKKDFITAVDKFMILALQYEKVSLDPKKTHKTNQKLAKEYQKRIQEFVQQIHIAKSAFDMLRDHIEKPGERQLKKLNKEYREKEAHVIRVEGTTVLDYEEETKYLSEAEREKYRIRPLFSSGQKGSTPMEYAETGELADSTNAGQSHAADDKTSNGIFIYVMSKNGKIYVADEKKESQKYGKFHHSSFLAGEPVAAAGELKISGGIITELTDKSGHYKPEIKYTVQVLEYLERIGYDVSTVTVKIHFQENGKMEEIPTDGKILLRFWKRLLSDKGKEEANKMTNEQFMAWQLTLSEEDLE
jgi:hypothetical protein